MINNSTLLIMRFFFFSSRRRHTRCGRDWSSDVCSSDLHCSTRRFSYLHSVMAKEIEYAIGGEQRPRMLACWLRFCGCEPVPECCDDFTVAWQVPRAEVVGLLEQRDHLIGRRCRHPGFLHSANQRVALGVREG